MDLTFQISPKNPCWHCSGSILTTVIGQFFHHRREVSHLKAITTPYFIYVLHIKEHIILTQHDAHRTVKKSWKRIPVLETGGHRVVGIQTEHLDIIRCGEIATSDQESISCKDNIQIDIFR